MYHIANYAMEPKVRGDRALAKSMQLNIADLTTTIRSRM